MRNGISLGFELIMSDIEYPSIFFVLSLLVFGNFLIDLYKLYI